MRPFLRSVPLLAAVAMSSCLSGPEESPAESPSQPGSVRGERPAPAPSEEAPQEPPLPPRGAWFPFTIRGRWDDPLALTYAIEGGGGPLSGRQTERAIEEAVEIWRATERVDLYRASAGDPADVTFSWQRKAHGDARPFGIDRSVAHTGPVRPGTFVHFDAGRVWVERHLDPEAPSDKAESLLGAALHELGHVFGLGHSPDPRTALYLDSRTESLHDNDLAGLHSLYGGGRDGPGDLTIDSSGTRACVLRRVAPGHLTAWDLFDIDGDGSQEVLVWRTDDDGHGALLAFHFRTGDTGPELDRTSGPHLNPLLRVAQQVELRVQGEERQLLLDLPGERQVTCTFDDQGRPGPPRSSSETLVPSGTAIQRIGDLDGDGRPEQVRQRP